MTDQEPVTNADELGQPFPATTEFDRPLLDVVHRAAVAAVHRYGVRRGWDRPDAPTDQHIDMATAVMDAVLPALRRAGRLLPPDTDTRTEWAVRLTWDDGRTEVFDRQTRQAAEEMFAYHDSRHRQQPKVWTVVPELVQRTTTRAVGPWRPVPTPTKETPDAQ